MNMFALIFAVIGAAILIYSIIKMKRCSSVATGKVVDISREVEYNHDFDHNQGFHPDRSVSLYPIVEYEVNGNKYVKKSNSSSNVSFIGQNKTVHYNPEKPEDCYVGSFIGMIIFSIVFIAVGIMFAFVK